jgi:trehalose 6-phosphate synthase/phosphatase
VGGAGETAADENRGGAAERRRGDMRHLVCATMELPTYTVQGVSSDPRKEWGIYGAVASAASASNSALWWVGAESVRVEMSASHSELSPELLELNRFMRVEITEELLEGWFRGFASQTLWPLLHGFLAHTRFDNTWWRAYVEVNQRFAKTICDFIDEYQDVDPAEDELEVEGGEVIEDDAERKDEGDTRSNISVWVHDYHLILVPKFIKERHPNVPVGYFLHTPFPSYECFRVHPQAKELLYSLTQADLVGTHVLGYSMNLQLAAKRLLEVGYELGRLFQNGHVVRLTALPIGCCQKKLREELGTHETRSYLERYHEQYKDMHVVIAVEKFDYAKGLPQKLRAIRKYLEKRDSADTVFLLIAQRPTSCEVAGVERIEEEVALMISDINATFSTPLYVPLILIREVEIPQLVALYARADVCLATSLQEGQNLIAKEFVASKETGMDGVVPGVLLLSEYDGAAQELAAARFVNPYDEESVAAELLEAVETPLAKREADLAPMLAHVMRYDQAEWAHTFVRELGKDPRDFPPVPTNPPLLYQEKFHHVASAFRPEVPGKKVVIVDYDGTLREFVARPEDAVPTEDLLEIFEAFDARDDLDVAIVSGRDRNFLDLHFSRFKFTLVAEHGFFIREKGDSEFKLSNPHTTTSWKDRRVVCAAGCRSDCQERVAPNTSMRHERWHCVDLKETLSSSSYAPPKSSIRASLKIDREQVSENIRSHTSRALHFDI